MIRFLIQRSVWVLAAAVVLALAAIPVALRLDMTTDLANLLPAHSPAVRSLREFQGQVGGHSFLSVLIESPDRAANVRFGDALARRLAAREWAYQVQFRRDAGFLRKRWQFLASARELTELETRLRDALGRAKVRHSPLALDLDDTPSTPDWESVRVLARDAGRPLEEFRENADGTAMLMQVQLRQLTSRVGESRGTLADAAADIAALRPEAYHPELRARLYGGLRYRLEEYDSIVHDVAVASLVTLPLILLIPALALRSLWQPIVVLVPVGIGMAWTYASAALVFGSLNLVTSFLFLIIFGMGDDYPIHLMHRIREELGQGSDLREATGRALRSTAPPLFFAALTNVTAFASLAWMQFRGFSQFGIIAGAGVCLILGATLITVPGLAALIGKRLRQRPPRGQRPTREAPAAKAELCWRRVAPMVGIWAVLVCGSVWVARARLELESDFDHLRPDFAELRELRGKIEVLGYQKSTPAVFFTTDYDASRAITRQLTARLNHDGEASPIGRVYSVASIVDGLALEKRECAERIRALLGDRALRTAPKDLQDAARQMQDFDLSPMEPGDIPADIRRGLTRSGAPAGEGREVYLVVVEPRNRVSLASEALAFSARLEGVRAGGREFVPAGEALILADILRRVRLEGWRTTMLLAWLAAAVVIYLAFRSWADLVVLVATVAGAIAISLAVLALAGVQLNFYNLAVLPLLVGLGIDYGIHILHRYHEEGLPARQAARKLAAAVGSAAATTAVGFAGLLLARHPGLWSMGFTASVGIAATAISCVVFLPSLADFIALGVARLRGPGEHPEIGKREVDQAAQER